MVAVSSADASVSFDTLPEILPKDILILRQADPKQLKRIRHTCSHVMTMAVKKPFPDAKVTIDPTTENGFYYDFDRSSHLLQKI
jgi:threonyl-tRNA synthetase